MLGNNPIDAVRELTASYVDLPHGDADYKTRWALIKAGFSRASPPGERRSKSRMKRGERGIWQRRYWEHLIRDDLLHSLESS